MERYRSYQELRKCEKEGKDFRVHFRWGTSGIAVMAPHGGGIEPGTTEIAHALAGTEHAFYSFEGLKCRGNLNLHITSRRFDEPTGIKVAEKSNTILVIHGCREQKAMVFIGGRDKHLLEEVKKALENARFPVRENPRFPGQNPLNICNRSRLGQGVQLEVSAGLRRMMFQDLARGKRRSTTECFEAFIRAVRAALAAP